LFSFGILAVAGILAIGANATNLMATTEYADFSIRGKSELTFNPNGSKNRDKFIHVKDYMSTVMALWKASILYLDFWGSIMKQLAKTVICMNS
jgi:hypothetical protein